MSYLTWAVALVTSVVVGCASGNRGTGPDNAPTAARLRASPFDTASPDMKAARVLAGCYSLTVGAWSDESKIPGRVTAAIPSRIHLDTARTERLQSGSGLVALTFGPSDQRAMEHLRAWSPVGVDSLQVFAWANQTSSVDLFLRRRSVGTLQGTARFFWDQIFIDPVTKRWLWETYPTAPATLRAVPCN